VRATVVRRGALLAGIVVAAGAATAAGPLRVWLFEDNLHVVEPGAVYRSAQLSSDRLAALADELSLRSILNLRGAQPASAWFQGEREVAAREGLHEYSLRLSAASLPSRDQLRRLIALLDGAERPLLIHCYRGSDRTGLAAALWVLLSGGDLEAARAQYGFEHGFVAALSRSDLPGVLDMYEAWLARRGVAHAPAELRRFVDTDYVPYFYAAAIEPEAAPRAVGAGEEARFRFRVTNVSPRPWRFTPSDRLGVHLGLAVEALDPRRPFRMEVRGETPRRDFSPGDSTLLAARLPALPHPGRYRVTVDLVDEEVRWFAEMGSQPLELELEVRAAQQGS
jgi:protein tyrosine phosphatase (PTP) superfamily phosphohydrolase (DUF442 family)